jgi:hypothetical protein
MNARLEMYDHLTLSACVVGEVHALFNAMALMHGKSGNDDDISRLIGIGQNISDQWLTSFEDEAKKMEALLPERRGK